MNRLRDVASIKVPIWRITGYVTKVTLKNKDKKASKMGILINTTPLTLLILILLSVTQASWAATASINRSIISENETITLVVQTQDMSTDHIDLDVLETDFEILGTSQSSHIQLFNGAGSSSKQWQITLAPRHSGTLIIPALTVGSETTRALEISVQAFDPANAKKQDQEVFIEVTLNKDRVYVQEQIIFTIKLFYKGPIRSGSLTSPNIKNAIIERLGDDINNQVEKNGTHYSVLERRFVLFPQESGTLTIDPIRFSGQIQDRQAPPRSRFDGFLGQSLFNDPFSPTLKNFRTKSTAQSVTVLPRPTAAVGKNWLPAQSLELTENITEQSDKLDIGQPLTRTITVTAKGLNSSQLPELPLPELENAKSYRDQKSQNNQRDKTGMTGISQQKIALVPTADGILHLPEIKIPWWDVIENQQRFAILPARTIVVTPGNDGFTVTPPETENTSLSSITKSGQSEEHTSSIWVAVSGLFFILWCATLYLLWKEKQNRKQKKLSEEKISEHNNFREKLNTIEKFCNENNISAAHTALLTWAKTRWPENPPQSLAALAAHSNQPSVISALQNMDRTLYSTTEKTSWDGQQFLNETRPLLTQKKSRHHQSKINTLPPLYTHGV